MRSTATLIRRDGTDPIVERVARPRLSGPQFLSLAAIGLLAIAALVEPAVRATTIALVVVGLGVALVASLMGASPFVKRWAWASLALHASLSVVIWLDGRLVAPDTTVFQGQAERLLAFWTGNLAAEPSLTAGKEAFPVLLATIYRLLGEYPSAALMVCAGALAVTVLVTADTARRLGGADAERIAAVLTTLIPPLVFWGSQLLREPFSYLLLAIAFNAAIRLTTRFTRGALGALLGALVLMLPVRGPLAFLVGGAMFLAFGFSNRSLARGVVKQAVIVVLVVACVAIIAPRYSGFEELASTDLESVQRSRDELATSGSTAYGQTADVRSLGAAIGFLPGATLVAALGPFPWQVSGAAALTLLDAWLLYAVYWLSFIGIRRMRKRRDRRWLLGVLPSAFLVGSLGLGNANFGLLVRMRAQILVFLIPLAAVGLAWRTRRRPASQRSTRPVSAPRTVEPAWRTEGSGPRIDHDPTTTALRIVAPVVPVTVPAFAPQAPRATWSRFATMPAMLLGLGLASFATSFVRERFLFQEALGSVALDRAVVGVAIGAIVASSVGLVLSLGWLAGRTRASVGYSILGSVIGVGLLVAIVEPVAGLVTSLGGWLGWFELSRQRAAQIGRQHVALIGAVLAAVPTLAAWQVVGTASVAAILIGYWCGALFQAAVAGAAGAGSHRPLVGPRSSIAWPVVYVAFLLVNAMLDRAILVGAGRGWSAAAAFAFTAADALVLLIVGPLASEGLAGRLPSEPSRRVTVAVVLGTAVAVLLWPFGLSLVLEGGLATGQNLARVEHLGTIYLLGVPAALYWLYRSRVVQGTSSAWRVVAMISVGAAAIHALVSVPIGFLGPPELVPLGWVASVYFAAFAVSRVPASRVDEHEDLASRPTKLGASA